jgi:chromosome segregation ATPase
MDALLADFDPPKSLKAGKAEQTTIAAEITRLRGELENRRKDAERNPDAEWLANATAVLTRLVMRLGLLTLWIVHNDRGDRGEAPKHQIAALERRRDDALEEQKKLQAERKRLMELIYQLRIRGRLTDEDAAEALQIPVESVFLACVTHMERALRRACHAGDTAGAERISAELTAFTAQPLRSAA